MAYISTKTYGPEAGFSVAYRQWRADSHCNLLHGYSLGFHFEFEAKDLDFRNWVMDFGGFKSLKEVLEDNFDHTLLVAEDDPELETFRALGHKGLAKVVVLPMLGCEGLAKILAEYINTVWLEDNGYGDGRVKLIKVEVRETPSNSASWIWSE